MLAVVGLNTKILSLLNQYKKVPIEFLADVAGVSAAEMTEALVDLANQGVVQTDTNTNEVSLASSDVVHQ